MRVVARPIIRIYIENHADAKTAMEEWYQVISKSEWNNFADLKNTFNSADLVGNNRFVFNVKGNDYRIVAIVLFKMKTVYIRFVGTHSEYDKIKDIKNI